MSSSYYLVLTDPRELWALDPGDAIQDAYGKEGIIRRTKSNGLSVEDRDGNFNPVESYHLPLTVTPTT